MNCTISVLPLFEISALTAVLAVRIDSEEHSSEPESST